jgi:hypothetical protein
MITDSWVWVLLSGLALLLALSVSVLKTKKPNVPHIDGSVLYEALRVALSPVTIEEIRFIRDKLNVTVNDVHRLDLQALKATGIKSLNVVGQTLKFNYASPSQTQAVYEAFQNDLESQVN